MFPLLDLDDDAIKVALGFSDPRSLSSTTMTSRRLRHLSDASWNELDKHIDSSERDGGGTPRERALSSYVVHGGGRSWLNRITLKVHKVSLTRSFVDAGIRCVSSEDLQTQSYIFHVCTETNSIPMLSTIPFSAEQSNLRFPRHCARVSMDLPLEREYFHLCHNFEQFLGQFYDSPEIFSRTLMSGLYPTDFQDFRNVFRSFRVTILAVDRCTLEPKILFKRMEVDYLSQHAPSIRTSRRNGRWRLEVENKWTMKCFESGGFVGTREVEFYFEHDCIGLTLCTVRA